MDKLIFVSGPPRSGTTMLQAMIDPSRAPECSYITALFDMYNFLMKPWTRENYRFDFYFKTEEQAAKTYRKMAECIIENIPAGTVLKDPRITLFLKSAKEIFPEAIFLVTIRDPKDIAASMRKVNNRKKSDTSINAIIDFIEPFFIDFPDWVTVVRYQDLCTKEPETISQLETICGKTMHLDSWAFNGDENDPFISDYYGKPPTEERIGSYKNLLTREEACLIDKTFEKLIRKYDFPLSEEPENNSQKFQVLFSYYKRKTLKNIKQIVRVAPKVIKHRKLIYKMLVTNIKSFL